MANSSSKVTQKQSENIRTAHRKWKIARRKRQNQPHTAMLYWEQATICAAL